MTWRTLESPVASIHLLPSTEEISEEELFRGASLETKERAELLKAAQRRSEFLRSRWLYRAVSGHSMDPTRHGDGDLLWPQGFVGSLSHKVGHVALVYMPAKPWQSVGVDLERIQVQTHLAEKIMTSSEKSLIDSVCEGSESTAAVFSAKEALFKAVFPLGRKMFWFHDAELVSAARDSFKGICLRFDLKEAFGLAVMPKDGFNIHLQKCFLKAKSDHDEAYWVAVGGIPKLFHESE